MYFLYLLLTIALAVPASTASDATVGLRLAFEPATLDWTMGDVPIHVINNVVEGLYGVNQAGLLEPVEAQGLPRRVGTTAAWRVSLRTDLKWSDGKPVRAADYMAAWSRLLAPKTASTYAYLLFDFEGAREFNAGKSTVWNGARAVGDHEIEMVLRERKADHFPTAALSHWATFPVRADLVTTFSDWGSEPSHMVFNGPYKILSYKHATKLELIPNSLHRTPGTLKKIEALIVEDDATALRLYESGRLHFMADLGTLDRAVLAKRDDLHSMKSPVLVYLGIDSRNSALAEKKYRQALSLAIDRTLFQPLLGPGYVPASGLTPELNLLRAADPGEARRLSGEPRLQRPEFGFFEKGSNKMIAEFIQAQWKKNLGLDANIKGAEIKSYWKRLARDPFAIFLNTYGPPVGDTRYYFELLKTGNPMNLGRWSNADYDQAVEKGDIATASRILDEETPIIPLYFRAYDYLVNPHLKGAVLNPMTSLFLKDAQLLQ
ncbi:MAG: peptide ABC transporter substrate-binding protein [Deltaproteobacteria bacterium]|nr:peptide ABC transporter substrate-binding protein [Deltaproteobacteria bacterium]